MTAEKILACYPKPTVPSTVGLPTPPPPRHGLAWYASALFLGIALVGAALSAGCLHATPSVQHRPAVSQLPVATVGLRFAADDPAPPAVPPQGNMFTRNWGWWLAAAAGTAMVADYATDGDILGLWHETSDPGPLHGIENVTKEQPLASAAGGSTISLSDVSACDFNFVATGESSISCEVAEAIPPE